jgi:protocatechuate 3,4-dioxygenase beta subunit
LTVFTAIFAGVTAVGFAAELAASGPAAANHLLRGVVKDEAGKPVPAAQVWALSSHWQTGNDEYGRQETDAQGRFELEIPSRWREGAAADRQVLAILAYRDGHGVGGIAFYRDAKLPDQPVEIALTAAASAALQVLDPDGKPLAGAAVKPAIIQVDTFYTHLSESQARQTAKQWGIEPRQTPWGTIAARYTVPLPAELEKIASATTDDQGRAALQGQSHASLYGVVIESVAHGTQNFSRQSILPSAEKVLETITLNPLMELTGQLVGKPEDVGGKKIRIFGYPAGVAGGKVYGSVQTTVTTDAEGKFQTAVPEGTVMTMPLWDAKSPLRPTPPEQFMAKRGAKNHVEIPLVQVVKVHGFVRDASSGKGVKGIRVHVWNWGTSEPLETDDSGRYETLGAAGPARVLFTCPADWIPTNKSPTIAEDRIAGQDHELKAILLQPAVVLAGTVLDDSGKPAADAEVLATWFGYSQALEHDDLNFAKVKTDAEGKFTIRGIDPASECRVTAEKDGAFTAAVKIVKGKSTHLSLAIGDNGGVKLEGRVVDAAGKPVTAAKLELWHQPWRPDYFEATNERIAVPAGDDWKTDSEGRFTSPALRPDGKYRVALVDPRFEPSQTAWLDADSGKAAPLDDLLARKLGEHLGTVADKGGKPIAGARLVFQGGGKRIEGTSDDQGKFKLSPAPDGPGLLFVSKDGCRFHGRRLSTFGQPLEIKLAKVSEPYGEKLEIKPPAMPLEKRRELARKLATDLIGQIGLDLTGEQRARVLKSLAEVDPQAALSSIDEKPFLVPMMNDMIRYQAARTLMASSPEDALELVDGLKTAEHMQALTYVELAGALPADKQARKAELLAEALVKAQALKEPGFRLAAIARVAEGLLDAGDKDRGTKLLKDNAEEVKKLNKGGYDAFLRGMFAEELAQVDTEAAIALVTVITDYSEKVRHLGNIAHELGGLNPAEAERVLGLIKKPPAGSNYIWSRDSDAVKVCYRMAPVDLPRANKLADASADPFHKAHARGAMAVAIAKSQPAEAAALMRQAFDALDESVRPGVEIPVSGGNAGNVGGWLVWQAQQLDPELGAEMSWRLRKVLPEDVSADPQQTWRDTEALGSAAMFLSLIDEELARDFLLRMERSPNTAYSRSFLPAWGLVDPQQAIEKVMARKDQTNALGIAVSVIPAIAATGEQRLKTIHYQAGLWRLDVEDIDP